MAQQAVTCPTENVAGDSACGCGSVAESFDGASRGFKAAIWVVIALNAVMFVVEIVAGQLAGSMALQADALDFLGDTLTYGVTLAVLGQALRVRAGAALLKGLSLGAMGLYVFVASVWRTFVEGAPEAVTMGAVGVAALAVNVTAALLLLRYRDGDANVRSVWLCSRNDALGNVSVLVAAGLVALTGTKWADIAVALIMASLFTNSALQIIRQATRELKSAAA